ncbi:MAG: ion transporter [Mariprofundaceae bacterium]|nr:ion transporter [Mariprofundaceae bacterium]
MTSPDKNRGTLHKILDRLLFVLTLLAVGIGFWQEAPKWLPLLILLTFFSLFVWRWFIAYDRQAYLKSNWLDLALIVLLASPMLRLLVALKVAGLLPVLRIGVLLRANRKSLLKLIIISQDSFPAAMTVLFGVVFTFGTLGYVLEHGQNPSFAEISDGLWWAFVTLTTVGYGDIFPITSAGRIVGVFTMIFGIIIYSLMIANVTVFVEEQGRKRKQEKEQALALKEASKAPDPHDS